MQPEHSASWLNAIRSGERVSTDDINALAGRIRIIGSQPVQDAVAAYVGNHSAVFDAIEAIRKHEEVEPGPAVEALQQSREAMIAAMQKHLEEVLTGNEATSLEEA